MSRKIPYYVAKKLHFSTIKFIVFESTYILKIRMQLKTNIQHVKKKIKKNTKKASLLLTGMSVQEVSHFGDVSLGSIKNGGSAIMEVLHSK